MPADTPCPSRDELQRLVAGALPETEATTVVRHVDACAACAAAVAALRAGERFRTAAPSCDSPVADAAPEKSSDPQTPTDTRVRYAFLAPPESVDEIGRLGPYRVLQVLGEGGMGIVFKAEDVQLQRVVALKVLKSIEADNSPARQRFLREARAAALIEHENVVTIFAIGEWKGMPFLAMQWLKGMSLAERFREHGPLELDELLRLGQQIARGLAAAHARGLIHRDIKPGNIWLEWLAPAEGPGTWQRVKILDFGLVRSAESDERLTQVGHAMGTPAYMSPEQARGQDVDHRTDLFSLGVLLYEMSAGVLPFRGANTLATAFAALYEQPAPLGQLKPELPAEYVSLVMALLAKQPGDRPATAFVVEERLDAIDRGAASPGAATAAGPPSPLDTPTRSTPVVGPARVSGRTRRGQFAVGAGIVAFGLLIVFLQPWNWFAPASAPAVAGSSPSGNAGGPPGIRPPEGAPLLPPGPAGWELVAEEDFGTPRPYLPSVDTGMSKRYPKDGKYVFELPKPAGAMSTNSEALAFGPALTDFTGELHVNLDEGCVEVAFREQSGETLQTKLMLRIAADGRYSVQRQVVELAGVNVVRNEEKDVPAAGKAEPRLPPARDLRTIKLMAVGDRIELYANGSLAWEGKDDYQPPHAVVRKPYTLLAGVARDAKDAPARVALDHLRIWKRGP